MASPNWADKTIWTGDNLPIMRRMNSESVDLIYLDPPFNSNTDYAAPNGSEAAGAAFKDTWTLSDVDVEWIDLIEDKHPALWRVLMAAMTDSDKILFDPHGRPPAGNASPIETGRQHLPALRPENVSLSETGHGRHLRATASSK